MKSLRISPQTVEVLERFLQDPQEWRYGYELSRETGLKSGTLYPILIRLAQHSLLETEWKTMQSGTPPRHIYRLTREGRRVAVAKSAEARPRATVRRPALGGGRA